MPQSLSTIGDVARDSGVKVQTIRFYEERGLLPAAPRSQGNQRLYGPGDINRLRFIRHSRELGFSLPEITELLSLSDHPDMSCDGADRIAQSQLVAVRRRLDQLTRLETELERIAAACAGGRAGDCRVIEALSDHDHCATDHAE